MNGRLDRICLIEGNELMGEALVDRFSVEGFACEWFKTGKSAHAALSRKLYQVIVSDIQLPDADGEVLFERMRSAGMSLPPCIFITGYGEIDRAMRLAKLTAEDYLPEQFDICVLLEKVRVFCYRGSPSVSGHVQLGISRVMRKIEAMQPQLAVANPKFSNRGETDVDKEAAARTPGWAGAQSLSAYMRECERRYIDQVLALNSGRIGESASMLGISRKNLWEKMRRLDMRVERSSASAEHASALQSA